MRVVRSERRVEFQMRYEMCRSPASPHPHALLAFPCLGRFFVRDTQPASRESHLAVHMHRPRFFPSRFALAVVQTSGPVSSRELHRLFISHANRSRLDSIGIRRVALLLYVSRNRPIVAAVALLIRSADRQWLFSFIRL
jgi:hypothetical protein